MRLKEWINSLKKKNTNLFLKLESTHTNSSICHVGFYFDWKGIKVTEQTCLPLDSEHQFAQIQEQLIIKIKIGISDKNGMENCNFLGLRSVHVDQLGNKVVVSFCHYGSSVGLKPESKWKTFVYSDHQRIGFVPRKLVLQSQQLFACPKSSLSQDWVSLPDLLIQVHLESLFHYLIQNCFNCLLHCSASGVTNLTHMTKKRCSCCSVYFLFTHFCSIDNLQMLKHFYLSLCCLRWPQMTWPNGHLYCSAHYRSYSKEITQNIWPFWNDVNDRAVTFCSLN